MCKLKTFIPTLILLEIIFSVQSTVVSAQDSQGTRKAAINKAGWIVPGRNDFRQEVKVIEKVIEGIQVTQRILKSPAEIIVDVSGRRIELSDKRKSNDRIFSVREFSVYEVKGHVFAYSVSLVPIDITRRGKLYYKSYIGAMYDLFYLDENGDGIFESKYGGLPLPKLPDWVRHSINVRASSYGVGQMKHESSYVVITNADSYSGD